MLMLKFVKSLLPKFGKDRLQEDINLVQTEIQNTVIPAYESAASALAKLQSKEAKDFERQWFSNVKQAKRTNLVTSIKDRLSVILDSVSMLEKVSETEFESEVVTAGLTVRKATIVRLVEVGGFVSTYAMRFLNYLYVLETSELKDGEQYIKNNLTPGEINLLKNHFFEFCVAVNAMARDKRQLEKVLTEVPEILVSDRGEAALKVFGEAKVDPTGVFRVKGFTYNPIYHIGLIIAERQANRYKLAKELKSILELRLVNLQQIRSGNPEANVDREIEMVQSRIDALDEKIRKDEESVQ